MDLSSLYKENFESLQMFCYRWTGNIDDARDISQESFAALLNKVNGNEKVDKPLSWLYKVAYNRCVNLHKFKAKFTSESYLYAEQIIDTKHVINAERLNAVRKAILKLTEKEKALIALYKLGFSYSQMAEVIEMNPASVGKTLTRAIDKLSKWVK